MAEKKQKKHQKEWNNMTPKEKFQSFGILAIIVIVVWAVISNYSGEDSKNLPPYTIEKNKCMKPFKCSFDIRLETNLSEDELILIAKKLKKDSPIVDKIFILYYLPCMTIDHGAWASSHFDPDLDVSIFSKNFSCSDNTK